MNEFGLIKFLAVSVL